MISQRKLSILRCPACKGDLAQDGTYLVCTGCGSRFPVVGDIVVFLTKANLSAFLNEPRGIDMLQEAQYFYPGFTFASNEDELEALQKVYDEASSQGRATRSLMNEIPMDDPDHPEELTIALNKSRDDTVSLARAGSAKRVLDWPTGNGFCLMHLTKQVGPETLVVSLDVNFRTLAKIKPYYDVNGFSDNMLFVIADARNMPFKDNVFQGSTVWGTLEVATPEEAFMETYRVLDDGGWVGTSGDQYKEGSPSMEIAEQLCTASVVTKSKLESMMSLVGFKNLKYEMVYEGIDPEPDTPDEERCLLPARGDWFGLMVAAGQK